MNKNMYIEKALYHNECWHAKKKSQMLKMMRSSQWNKGINRLLLFMLIPLMIVIVIAAAAPAEAMDIIKNVLSNAPPGDAVSAAGMVTIDSFADTMAIIAAPVIIVLIVYIAMIFADIRKMYSSSLAKSKRLRGN
jgi:hypothetical protein